MSAPALRMVDTFQSTLSVRRATRRLPPNHHHKVISIHALREESDSGTQAAYECLTISIHALREESDWPRLTATGLGYGFQSTLSVRRATC